MHHAEPAVTNAQATEGNDGEPAWVENRASSRWLPPIDLDGLWAYREVALALAIKDLSVRYKQTFFGVAWAVLQPVLAVVLFTVIFGHLAGLPTDGVPYPVFTYAGMVLWLNVSGSVSAGSLSLVGNRELVSKVYFPRMLAPLAALVPPLVDFGVALVILAVIIAGYGIVPGPELALFPFWIVAAVLVAFGLSLWLAALNVKYRDVKYALSFGLQLWFFASPVVYSSSLVQGDWRYIYAANPMVAVLDGFRWSVLGTQPPGREAIVSLVVALLLLVAGAVYFQRAERHAADLI